MAAQCQSCRFWERRGGFLEQRRQKQCVVLEDADARVSGAVTGLLRLAAAAGQCPQFEVPVTYQDSYRSLDLEDQEDAAAEAEGVPR